MIVQIYHIKRRLSRVLRRKFHPCLSTRYGFFLTNQRRLVNFKKLNFAGFSRQRRKTKTQFVVIVFRVAFHSDDNWDNWGQHFKVCLPYRFTKRMVSISSSVLCILSVIKMVSDAFSFKGTSTNVFPFFP